MGKNLRQQRRGKGSPRYRSPSHRFAGKAEYDIPKGALAGIVKNIIDAPGRLTPLAEININGKIMLQVPHEGMRVGQEIGFSEPKEGNIVPLKNVPEGTKIYNIEIHSGDGGKMCRSSGSSAMLITKDANKSIILLSSGSKKILSSDCLATIGTASGSGRTEKPFMKAGKKHHAMKAMNRPYPRTSGVAMNAVDHPFGGKNLGKHKTVKRSMPPGKKVGSIAARRTGKKKRK